MGSLITAVDTASGLRLTRGWQAARSNIMTVAILAGCSERSEDRTGKLYPFDLLYLESLANFGLNGFVHLSPQGEL